MKRVLLLAGLLLVTPPVPAGGSDLETVSKWMAGSFNSAEQAAADPDYYNITLEMAPIWASSEGEHWLYVEQAAAATREKPYRQRVYRLQAHFDGTIESSVYLLPDPEQAVGAWQAETPLADLSADELELRTGCSVFLKRVDESTFAGETRGSECVSSLRGAAYATSEVVVTADGIESWDRGFDAAGTQVWGAEKGAYLFKRE